jgi:hypothetical protein
MERIPRINHGQAVEDPEIVRVASDQLVDSMIEKTCGEKGVCNSLSSELMPLDERKGAESPPHGCEPISPSESISS